MPTKALHKGWKPCPGCGRNFPGLAVSNGRERIVFCAGDACADVLRAEYRVQEPEPDGVLRCPGCGGPAGFWKYADPPRLVNRGSTHEVWATAAEHEVRHGHWRGGCCIHLAARAKGK